MMNSSSCMKRYENYQTATHHSPSLSFNYSNNFPLQKNSPETTFNYSNANDWTGFPLIKFADSSPFRRISNNSFHEPRNNYNKTVRKVNHAAAVSKSLTGCQNETNPFNDENIQIDKIENFITQKACDNGEVHIALNHGNGTFLPRIIKPRKRRKKDRKPTNNLQQTVENASSTFPFTFSSTTNETMQNLSDRNVDCVNENNNYNYIQNSRNLKATKCDANVYFNNTKFNSNLLTSNVASSSSISSSPISLSNSSLSSSTNSSCSCRLCDPNCKIWSFPLRRSFSDNSASKMESKDSCSIDNVYNQKSAKDVGVIGGNRSKSDGKSCTKSLLTLMDIIESEQNQQNLPSSMSQFINNPNLNILDNSVCNLVLNNLRISDDILSSTIKTVNEDISNNDLNDITQHLSSFNLLDNNNEDPSITAEQNNRIITNSTSASLVKFENFIETPLKKQDQSNFFSQNLFAAHNLMNSEESNMLGNNHNSFNNYDISSSKCDELLYSNFLNNDESNFNPQFTNGIENLSLFI